MIHAASLIYAAICLVAVLFQVCLIAGAPWGRLTQGGMNAGKLPSRGRVIAGFSILLLLIMGLSILSFAGKWPLWPLWTGWATLATTFVAAVMNMATPSGPERRLWAPVTLVMLLLAIAVVLSA